MQITYNYQCTGSCHHWDLIGYLDCESKALIASIHPVAKILFLSLVVQVYNIERQVPLSPSVKKAIQSEIGGDVSLDDNCTRIAEN